MPRDIIPYNIHLKELARKLRKESTIGEKILWNYIKHRVLGYEFHRQKPLLNYIADFYCHELKLIIEIDGKYHLHEEQYALDVIREDDLKKFGLTIIRFTEDNIRRDIQNVLRVIEYEVSERASEIKPQTDVSEQRTHP